MTNTNTPELSAIREALEALLTAVTYDGLKELPNGAGKGYFARVPDAFVDNARAALESQAAAPAEGGELQFQQAIASLGGVDDEFNKWHLDEGEFAFICG